MRNIIIAQETEDEMSRARGKVETAEYVGFSRRAFRGLMTRVRDSDPEDVALAIELYDELGHMLSDALEDWVESDVPPTQRLRSWTSLARALGRTRQGVEQKYSERAKARQARAQARYRASAAA